MLADDERTLVYANAIRKTVKPGDRVLEIGTGIGFFSVVAAQAGAAHVDAVELTPAAYVGRHVAEANGCADRIAFRRIDSRQLALDAPVDVIIADLRGPLPFCGDSLATLIDARTRLLRSGGTIIAARDTLYAAPCATPAVWRREIAAGLARPEVRLDPVVPQIYDTPFRCCIEPEALRAQPSRWLEVDYLSLQSTDHVGFATWTFPADATLDGLALWFDSDVGAGERLSAAPSGNCTVVYRQLYLPFRAPLQVSGGTTLRAEIGVRLMGRNYLWSWKTFLRPLGQQSEESFSSQSSLAELVVDPAAMPYTAADEMPRLGTTAEALAFLIAKADGRRTIAELSEAVLRTFPAHFPNANMARSFVTEWVCRLASPSLPLE
jgi:protein arginine N-methyltransferase 1